MTKSFLVRGRFAATVFIVMLAACGPQQESIKMEMPPTAQTAWRNAPNTSTSGVNYPTTVYPYPGSGAIIGQGWDAFNGIGTSATCVEADAVRLERNVYSTNVRLIQSSYEMVKDTATSVNVAASALGFGASGGFSTANDRQINTDDQNFLFTFEASDGSTFAIPRGATPSAIFAYKEDAAKLADSQKSHYDVRPTNQVICVRNSKPGEVELIDSRSDLILA